MFVEKAERAEQAGALALIVVNNEDGIFMMAGRGDNSDETNSISIPTVMVSQR